ncbi:hypothetical protein ECE50_001935 [Chitinophaga sp. Mgbs1]|uniref:Uncharacterized protein n=1 Tax=Chitinophaga solisilvae TaxID=1233460 RepID=A0A9Q5D8B5_9BACT|nr:hypothetical protein [Chitinophaga solisilvae]
MVMNYGIPDHFRLQYTSTNIRKKRAYLQPKQTLTAMFQQAAGVFQG